MEQKHKLKIDNKPLFMGVIAGIIASLCCITPLVIVFFGLASISTALVFTKYGYIFSTLAIIFIGIALLIYYKKKNKTCSVQEKKLNKYYIMATVIIMIIVYILTKYWLVNIIAQYVYK